MARTDDTSHSEGRMIFGLFAVRAKFEREPIRERTIAGMYAARGRGVRMGRPRKLSKVTASHRAGVDRTKIQELQRSRRRTGGRCHDFTPRAEIRFGVNAFCTYHRQALALSNS
ncbi:recombinase family protein [Mesorhizobium sp. CAU 1741]|uniref:recombinase family protein n=1 Tax=Mesorhizobium sp. CAU 1741 TaxID=3140366 RepID=UPI00325A5A1F